MAAKLGAEVELARFGFARARAAGFAEAATQAGHFAAGHHT